MPSPAPIGLGPAEDGRVAAWVYGRFHRENGGPQFDQLPPGTRKAFRRDVREVVDALQAAGYRIVLEEPGASDFTRIGRALTIPTADAA